LINPQCWFIGLFSGLAFAPISAFGGLWGLPFLQTKLAITKTSAAMICSCTFIGFAMGCPLAGYFSDRWNNRKILMTGGTAIGCAFLSLLIYLPFHSQLFAALLMTGFGFFTSFFFISFAMMREINLPLLAGTAIGFINSFNAIFGALSEPAVGALLDRVASLGAQSFSLEQYQYALTLLPLAMLVALGIACCIRETHCIQRME